VFPFIKYRDEADRLLSYILAKHGDDMVNELSMDLTVTYGSCRASLMSDEQNEFLCTGFESGSVTTESTLLDVKKWEALLQQHLSLLPGFAVKFKEYRHK